MLFQEAKSALNKLFESSACPAAEPLHWCMTGAGSANSGPGAQEAAFRPSRWLSSFWVTSEIHMLMSSLEVSSCGYKAYILTACSSERVRVWGFFPCFALPRYSVASIEQFGQVLVWKASLPPPGNPFLLQMHKMKLVLVQWGFATVPCCGVLP